MSNFIVTTTINKPTEAIYKFSKKKDWKMIVVGDQKTEHNLYKNIKNIIYLTPEDQINIDELTIELSGIIAQSKVNFSNLPEIEEFNNHKNLVEVALVTAEDLHGRYLAALRNNEYDVAKSIVSAINLNKSTEIKAFENSLEDFNNKSLNAYNNFEDLP